VAFSNKAFEKQNVAKLKLFEIPQSTLAVLVGGEGPAQLLQVEKNQPIR
jgi:hypothetical protein